MVKDGVSDNIIIKALVDRGFDEAEVTAMTCPERHVELAVLVPTEKCVDCGEQSQIFHDSFLCMGCYAIKKAEDFVEPESVIKSVTFKQELSKIIKSDDDRFLVGGYASPELRNAEGVIVPDLKGQAVDLPSLDKAMQKMIKRVERWNLLGVVRRVKPLHFLQGPHCDLDHVGLGLLGGEALHREARDDAQFHYGGVPVFGSEL